MSDAFSAKRAAEYYGPDLSQRTRKVRIGVLLARIEVVETQIREAVCVLKERCERCQYGVACFTDHPAPPDLKEKKEFLLDMILIEQMDEAYAKSARVRPVEYERHVNPSCRYWQNIRFRKFVSVGCRCQRCGGGFGQLEAHHLHYNTLGFEELDDLQALCRNCHQIADREREAETRYENGLHTYMTKKYGDEDCWPDNADEEFGAWLDSKEDENDDEDEYQ
jgi:hypothetical protein